MIHTGIDDRQFVLYYFLCIVRDIIIFNARSPKFSPSLILFWSCLLLKIVHTYQTFLEQNLKAPLYRSVQLLEGVHAWNEVKDFVVLIIIILNLHLNLLAKATAKLLLVCILLLLFVYNFEFLLGLLYFPREVFDFTYEDLLCGFYSLTFKLLGKVVPVILI